MATTTNYGWTTPDDTGLVKDGASAIRTLGSSIDTTTKALNPSTTLGDIEYRSSTANTNTRLGIGTTGQVLTVNGGVPSWATPSATTPTFVGCMLTKTASQSTSINTFTTITFNSELLDTDGFHDNTTNNSRITIPTGKGGKYAIYANTTFADSSAGTTRNLKLLLNGSDNTWVYNGGIVNCRITTRLSTIMTLVAGDYIQVQTYQTAGTIDVQGNDIADNCTLFGVQYLGA